MKFLVFSDSHGSSRQMQQVLRSRYKTLSGVLHLGDGTDEFEMLATLPEYKSLLFLSVCGNGEAYRPAELRPPMNRILTYEGVSLYLTHGHRENVSMGTEHLASIARQNGCTLALHGHTHIPRHLIDRGVSESETAVEILCPGSIARPRAGAASFGVLELTNGQALAYWEEI